MARDAIDERGAEAAWPAQRAEIERAVASVGLDDPFVPVACPDALVGVQCWWYDGAPTEALEHLGSALTAAGVTDVVADCAGTPSAPDGTAMVCSARGTVGGRALALMASSDVDPGATTRSERVADSSTIVLLADLAAP